MKNLVKQLKEYFDDDLILNISQSLIPACDTESDEIYFKES